MCRQGNGQTVLVVDDDKIICDLICSVLSRCGFQVMAAPNGLKLVSCLRVNRPDLLLLDVSMSWIDGYQLCRMVRRLEGYERIPIIFISARSAPEDIQHGYECGADDYITKPFDINELVRAIFKHLKLEPVAITN